MGQKKKFLGTLKDEKTFSLAQDLFDDDKFDFALKQFRKLEVDFPNEPILLYRIGTCLLYEKGNKAKAFDYLSKIDKNKFSKSDFLYRLAQAQFLVGKYDEAIASATEVQAKKIEPFKIEAAKQLIKQADVAKSMPMNSKYSVQNAGATINTIFDETQPVINLAGNYLLWAYYGEKSIGGLQAQPGAKTTDGVYFSDIYLSQKNENGTWNAARPYDSLTNSTASEYPLCISYDGQRLITGKQESYANHSISFSKKENNGWSLFGELSGLINTPGYEGGATVFPNNKKIIFSSDRLGGFGGKDLYSAELMEDSTWGNVKNLGLAINTANNEDFPHIHSDGMSLHFSSNGPKSMGAYDIFISTYSPDDDTWSNAINMEMPINSTDDDIQFQVAGNGKTAYFSSGRMGGIGGSDIYEVNGLSYKPDLTFEKIENERLAVIQKKYNDSLELVKTKALEAQQAITMQSEHKIIADNSQQTTKQEALAQLEADKLAKAEAKRQAIITAKAEKEAKRLEKIATDEAAKLAKEEALAAKAIKNAEISDWDWSKYDLSTEAAIAKEFGDVSSEGLVYKVQIASGTLPKNISNLINTDLGQIEELEVKGNKKYLIEKSSKSINEAFSIKNKAIELGISDAFITGFYNGKRFYLIDLVKKGILRK